MVPAIKVPALMLDMTVEVIFKLPATALEPLTRTASPVLGAMVTEADPALMEPGRLMSLVVREIAELVELRVCPLATVTVPEPLVETVTPVAPEEPALKVTPPLLALVVSCNVPVAVIPPETVTD